MKQSTQSHILVVDDDPEIGRLLREYLEPFSYRISYASDGISMRKLLKQHVFDLLILDVMLPGQDGISLCQQLRQTSEVPIIMLSAAGEESDRILGLEIGADDYLAKPFNSRELLARVKALLRRSHGSLGEARKTGLKDRLPNIKFANWTLDQRKRCLLTEDDTTISLSKGEYDLLLVLIEHAGRVLTRDQLMDLTRGEQADPTDRSIDVQIGRLRKKIEVDPKQPKILMTQRGHGYQFNADISNEH